MAWNSNYPTGVAEYASWDLLVAIASPSDGDQALYGGLLWTYYAAGLAWVPDDVYHANPVNVLTVIGSETTPELVVKGWSGAATTGSGSIATDGTHITIATNGVGNRAEISRLTAAGPGKGSLMYGQVNVTAGQSTRERNFALVRGTGFRTVALTPHTGPGEDFPALLGSGNSKDGAYRTDLPMVAHERFAMLFTGRNAVGAEGCEAYVSGMERGLSKPACSSLQSAFTALATEKFIIGADGGGGTSTAKVRNFVTLTFDDDLLP